MNTPLGRGSHPTLHLELRVGAAASAGKGRGWAGRGRGWEGGGMMGALEGATPAVYIMEHFPFSAQGLFFLSGAWIRGSLFSFSSTNSRIAAMLLDSGQRSIVAWYFMFSICFFSASLSMAARVLGSMGDGSA